MDEALRRELEAAVAGYRASLAPRIGALEALRERLEAGTAGAAQAAQLQRELHSIAGSGRTFGLPAVSETARAAEAFVDRRCADGGAAAADWRDLKPLLEALARSAP